MIVAPDGDAARPDAPLRPLTRRMLPQAAVESAQSSATEPDAHDTDSFTSDVLALTATLGRFCGDEQQDLAR